MLHFQPADPNFVDRVRESFARQRVMSFLGVQIAAVAPGDGELLIARGQLLKAGRSLMVSRSDVSVVKDGRESLCATLLQTLMTMKGKPEVRG